MRELFYHDVRVIPSLVDSNGKKDVLLGGREDVITWVVTGDAYLTVSGSTLIVCVCVCVCVCVNRYSQQYISCLLP